MSNSLIIPTAKNPESNKKTNVWLRALPDHVNLDLGCAFFSSKRLSKLTEEILPIFEMVVDDCDGVTSDAKDLFSSALSSHPTPVVVEGEENVWMLDVIEGAPVLTWESNDLEPLSEEPIKEKTPSWGSTLLAHGLGLLAKVL